ncbi:uncharacterized protein LOC106094693 [Stomoxys calcitrans]|uniref:uncharacterized protein LOC106094693 n=1 Tax=Stomoxys calcitrans TaxID=35570 RepID=UPI0027E2FEDB|nr:uncharacterized protein LOC106094693 [Stomoxys calcitrans]
MEPENINVTFKHLLNISLGDAKLDKANLSILQSVLLLLLHKLDCQHEKVRLSGVDFDSLKKILVNSRNPPLPITVNHENSFQKYYQLLDRLNIQTKNLQQQLENHFSEIKKQCATDAFRSKCWDLYAAPTEDLCTLYSEYNKAFCTMAQNPTFNGEMRRRMTQPVLKRMQHFESQIEAMREKLRLLNGVQPQTGDQLKLLPSIIGEIETKRLEIDGQWSMVREAMQETQEMLNCKLDRITLPALRKDLENRFAAVDSYIALMKKQPCHCPNVRILDVGKKGFCISCGRNDFRHSRAALDLKFASKIKCQCALVKKAPTILERMDKIKVKTYKLVASSRISYNGTVSSAFTQQLRDKGHYVHS